MEIISVRRGFASDHSSTSYEFLAVDKPLGKKERSEVSKLSSRANPTSRRVDFTYHVDGYDIPGGWEQLMERHYDVMYSESYDWWTLAIAFDGKTGKYDDLNEYGFSEDDGLGIEVSKKGQRIVVTINCRIDPGMAYSNDCGYDPDEDDESGNVETDDDLLNLLVQIRTQIINGDYRALYAVWETYGDEDSENPPPKPKNHKAGESVVNEFAGILDVV